MIVDHIQKYLSGAGAPIEDAILAEVGRLAGYAFSRQFGERQERTGALRLSSIGRCIRSQAYSALGFPANGKELDARSKMVFFMGDMVELAIVQLARIAGCPITSAQASLSVDGIEGHPDGILRDHLVEVKSMSSYGFKEFERGMIDDGYRYQCNAYMEALGLSKCVMVALNKDAGVLHEQIISRDAAIVADIKLRIAVLKAATKDNLPPRPFKPDAKGFYPWQCRFCAHFKSCLPNSELVLVGKAYKLREKEIAHEAA